MPYTPPAIPWEDLPSEVTPVTAAWLTQVDEVLVEHDEALEDLAGAANLGTVVDAKGDLLAGTANDTVGRLAAGANGRVLTADSTQTTGLGYQANPTPAPVPLADVASVALDAAAGKLFKLSATGNRTIAVPTNAVDGRSIVIAHKSDATPRTLALTTGTGGFAFGTDITALSATAANVTDYIGCIYDATAQRWRVVGVVKGY